ncbi:MAG: hypothetical protein PHS44_00415 [Candidatus Dojkabacteria bacterium]|nr:hypothetical protein [Candidatus Dojkabacteria bacterium]
MGYSCVCGESPRSFKQELGISEILQEFSQAHPNIVFASVSMDWFNHPDFMRYGQRAGPDTTPNHALRQIVVQMTSNSPILLLDRNSLRFCLEALFAKPLNDHLEPSWISARAFTPEVVNWYIYNHALYAMTYNPGGKVIQWSRRFQRIRYLKKRHN